MPILSILQLIPETSDNSFLTLDIVASDSHSGKVLAVSGAFLRLPIWRPPHIGAVFDDSSYWVTPKKMSPNDEGTLRSNLGVRMSRSRSSPAWGPTTPPTDYVVTMTSHHSQTNGHNDHAYYKSEYQNNVSL
jgi:hypothetical protein